MGGGKRVAATLAGLTLLVGAAPAAAQTLWVTPTGNGTCSQGDPCGLEQAVAAAGSGATVNVRADEGAYTVNNEVDVTVPVTLAGYAGRPVINFTSANGLAILDGGSDLHNLALKAAGTGLSGFVLAMPNGGTADRMVVTSTATNFANACYVRDGTLTNSLCWAPDATAVKVVADSRSVSQTLKNVTAYSSPPNGFGVWAVANSNHTATIHLRSVIAHGDGDLVSTVASGSHATFDIDHSNYATTNTLGAPADRTSFDDNGTSQSLAPQFVNASAGNFHEAPTSPTIDAGLLVPGASVFDFDGDPRTLNDATDIGADEFRSPPLAATTDPRDIGATYATLTGTLNPNGAPTSYYFEYGRTRSYGHSTLPHGGGGGLADEPVSAAVRGLTPGTTYHFRLSARSARGTSHGGDVSFTTGPPRTGRCVNRVTGTAAADVLHGSASGDLIKGLGGNDRLFGGRGRDCLSGGAGNDRLSGGPGGDRLTGGAGRDRLTGGGGTDRFVAGPGNDRIFSADGRREKVSCGAGRDSVTADRRDKLKGCEKVKRRHA
jgi:hypothetical protein